MEIDSPAFCNNLSKILETTVRIKFSLLNGSFFLKTGVISASSNFSGKVPVVTMLLKRSFKNGAHESLHFLRIFAGKSLSVSAFLGFKELTSLITSIISIS